MPKQEHELNRFNCTAVLNEVYEERERQERKWGPQNHSPADWLMILGEEVGEANKAALEHKFAAPTKLIDDDPEYDRDQYLREYRAELIQVAAVAVAMIESLDRNELGSGRG